MSQRLKVVALRGYCPELAMARGYKRSAITYFGKWRPVAIHLFNHGWVGENEGAWPNLDHRAVLHVQAPDSQTCSLVVCIEHLK